MKWCDVRRGTATGVAVAVGAVLCVVVPATSGAAEPRRWDLAGGLEAVQVTSPENGVQAVSNLRARGSEVRGTSYVASSGLPSGVVSLASGASAATIDTTAPEQERDAFVVWEADGVEFYLQNVAGGYRLHRRQGGVVTQISATSQTPFIVGQIDGHTILRERATASGPFTLVSVAPSGLRTVLTTSLVFVKENGGRVWYQEEATPNHFDLFLWRPGVPRVHLAGAAVSSDAPEWPGALGIATVAINGGLVVAGPRSTGGGGDELWFLGERADRTERITNLQPPGTTPLNQAFPSVVDRATLLFKLGSRIYAAEVPRVADDPWEVWVFRTVPVSAVLSPVTPGGYPINGNAWLRLTDSGPVPLRHFSIQRDTLSDEPAALAGMTAVGAMVPAPGGSRYWFRARTAAHGWELWSTDGTITGTRRETDLVPGVGDGVSENPVIAADGTVHLVAPLGEGGAGQMVVVRPRQESPGAPTPTPGVPGSGTPTPGTPTPGTPTPGTPAPSAPGPSDPAPGVPPGGGGAGGGGDGVAGSVLKPVVTAKSRQRQPRKRPRIVLRAGAGEAVQVRVSGTIAVPRRTPVTLTPRTVSVKAAATGRIVVRVPKAKRKTVRAGVTKYRAAPKRLKAKRKVVATLTVRLRDRDGNAVTRTVRVRLV